MGDAALLSLVVRTGCTMVFVLAMGWTVARASPRIAAVAIAMPVVIGPGFLVLVLERDVPFVLRAAEDGLGALSGTVAFAVVVALLAGRAGRVAVLAAALVAWVCVVTLVGVATGLAQNAAAFALAYVGGVLALPAPPAPPRAPSDWSVRGALPRAVAAGALVGIVTLAAGRLGPGLSGTLIALPVGMLFVAAGLMHTTVPATTRHVMAAALRGSAALSLFLVILRIALPMNVPPLVAVLAAMVGAVALAIGLGMRARASG